MNIKTETFFLIAGPCVVESEELCFEVAEQLKNITSELNIPFVFKASYKKANRSKLNAFTTIGEEKALQILANIKSKLEIPILTDVHETTDCDKVKDIVDVIQIPAFLCRQTELLIAAGKTGKIVNIKKGQFVNAEMMRFAAEKISSTNNKNIWLTERGTQFGYQDLIVDFRNIQLMKQFGFPVIFDATHSVQQPNQSAGVSGGKPEFIETLAKCAIVSGVDGIFLETHPNPSQALSDGANMLPLNEVKSLLEKLIILKK
ncbi:MAG: 3-deoxy-8-phosphooctulonate synthase [Bacteroidetes bacterium]|nr:3-deoxy-8-phosphooctulonate synthase [Bacteroidota bacterium]